MTNILEELQVILHGIWQRRWLALAVAWGVCLFGWLAVSLVPNVYMSHARVFVQSQSVLPGAGPASPLDAQKAIDQVRQTMTSAAVLERVVRITDLGKGLNDAEIAGKAAALRGNLHVVSQQDNLFEISAASSDPTLTGQENGRIAAQMVAGLIQAFQETSLAGGREETSQSLKFLDQQIAEQARALEAAEQKRVDFEQRNGTGLPGGGTIEDRMTAMRTEMAQIDSQLLSAQSALAGINGQLAATAPDIVTVGGPGGNAALAQAETQLAQARANGWTDSHPDVQALKRQIETLRRLGNSGGAAGSRSPNPAYASLRSMQAERAATVSALQARKSQIQGDLAAIAQRQAQNPGLVAEQDRLNRDYDAVKQQYDKLVGDRETVRLRGDAQNQGGIVQFRVIDPPSMSGNPASPNRPMLLFAVLVAGVGAGIGAAFALSQLRTTYATTGRLERATGLPVIGGITEVSTPARIAQRRRQARYFYAGCGGLAGLCVLLLAVEFIQRGMSA